MWTSIFRLIFVLYCNIKKAQKKSWLNFINYKPQVSIGYIYRITYSKNASINNCLNTTHSVGMFNLYLIWFSSCIILFFVIIIIITFFIFSSSYIISFNYKQIERLQKLYNDAYSGLATDQKLYNYLKSVGGTRYTLSKINEDLKVLT